MAISKKKVKISSRDRTKLRIRRKVSGSDDRPRVSVFRSSKHIYAQLILDVAGSTVVAASTLDKDVVEKMAALAKSVESDGKIIKSTKSLLAARAVGIILAQRAISKNIQAVVFDRNGFVYKGRIKALADGARESGLQF